MEKKQMNKPKTIKIFLADGEPTGTKIVELSNWTGIVYLIPRTRLKSTLNNPGNKSNLDSQCVYFLIGESEEDNRSVYVGEAEEFSKRINQHNQNKDFWNLVMVFTSKDDNLTKAHVKYLESKVTQEIKNNNTVHIENGNIPSKPKLPRSDIAEMEEFYEQMKVVASSLGYTFLEKIDENSDSDDTFYITGPDSRGIGKYTDEGFFVLEGSTVRAEETKSINQGLSVNRFQAMKSEYLEKKDKKSYLVVKKIKFNSPSYAGGFVTGGNINGWKEWKDKAGKTLDELKRK